MLNRRDAILAAAGTTLGLAMGWRHALAQDATMIPEAVRQLLDPDMEATLLDTVTAEQDTFYVVAQTEAEFGSGEPVVARLGADGAASLVADFGLLPHRVVRGSLSAAAGGPGAFDLSEFVLDEGELSALPPSAAAAASDILDGKLSAEAIRQVGQMSSRNAPGTDNGNLACAWAVNEIARRALGSKIGGGLATANMIKVLRERHHSVGQDEASATPGTIVISPTEYRPSGANIGHVGIISTNGEVLSNSSGRAMWLKTHDIARWLAYYTERKGLKTEYFRLDDRYFL